MEVARRFLKHCPKSAATKIWRLTRLQTRQQKSFVHKLNYSFIPKILVVI